MARKRAARQQAVLNGSFDMLLYYEQAYLANGEASSGWNEPVDAFHFQRASIRPLRTQHAVLASYAGAPPEWASRLETNVPDCRFGNSRMYGSRS